MKKKFLKSTFILSTILLTLLPLSAQAAISGDGTEESPFMITNQEELELVTDFPSSHFKLANDIVMNGVINPLCFHSENQMFTGVFDGNGHTISDLIIHRWDTDSKWACASLFYDNGGTIKNLNLEIKEMHGFTKSGIARENQGTISNCRVAGEIVGGDYPNGDYIYGIVQVNRGGLIEKCEVSADLKNSTGIAGIALGNDENGVISKCKVIGNYESKSNSVAGICSYNNSKIEDCCFLGTLSGSTVAGICSDNGSAYVSSSSIIKNCYVVATFTATTNVYPIACNAEETDSKIENCYYDKSVSALNSTTYGTPKSTMAMKMKQTYQNNWDFDTAWGIDENINNGYPYLLWEYPDAETKNPYRVNNVAIKDLSGNKLERIPDSSFYFEINVTKNDNSKASDSLIIALYDEDGAFIDLKYMSGTYYQNQSISFGAMINKPAKKIGNIKAFVWDSISGMHQLSNSMEITN